MQLADFNYHLPDELIAHFPPAERTASRLLCLNGINGAVQHRQFRAVLELINPGDLLVLNNTRVIPARLFGHKASGGKVEILVERIVDAHRVLAHVRASKTPKIGSKIHLAHANDYPHPNPPSERRGELKIKSDTTSVEVLSRHDDLFELQFLSEQPVLEILHAIGHIPLPPYINRADEIADRDRYQTVYAKHPGAIAAPTAGLHFDEALLQQLRAKNVEIDFVTLHVGAGTFQPVRVENIQEHVMHAEYMEVSQSVCEKIRATKKNNKRVIAVGTTSVRCLETAARSGKIETYAGDTRLFIYPGFQFHCVDAIITNFHLPQSTLLMLICAFAGRENVMSAYDIAIAEHYRFFSYGDAMWVEV